MAEVNKKPIGDESTPDGDEIDQVPDPVAKRKEDGLVPRKLLAEAQLESRKRKEKIKTLKAQLASASAEAEKTKGIDTRLKSVSNKLRATEVEKVVSSLGKLSDEAKAKITDWISPHISVSDDFEVVVDKVELDKTIKALGGVSKKNSEGSDSSKDDVLSILHKKKAAGAKGGDEVPQTSRAKLSAAIQAIKDGR